MNQTVSRASKQGMANLETWMRGRTHLGSAVLAACLLLVGGVVFAEPPEAPKTKAAAVDALRAAETCDDQAVGDGGIKSDTYRAFEVLREETDAEELARLTDDESPVLRCYAFRALADSHPDVDIHAVLLRHLDDPGKVWTFQGCCKSEENVTDVMVRDARKRLTAEQAGDVFGRMLKVRRPLLERDRVLWTGEFGDEFLSEVVRLAKEGNLHAMRGLAVKRRPEAVDLVLKVLETADFSANQTAHGLIAVSAFPHPRFLPRLRELRSAAARSLSDTDGARHYYGAWAAFESEEAATLLQAMLKGHGLDENRRRSNAGLLFDVVKKHPVAVFVPLLRTLASDWGRSDAETRAFLAGR